MSKSKYRRKGRKKQENPKVLTRSRTTHDQRRSRRSSENMQRALVNGQDFSGVSTPTDRGTEHPVSTNGLENPVISGLSRPGGEEIGNSLTADELFHNMKLVNEERDSEDEDAQVQGKK